MQEYGREVGVSFWESPERKCLNGCTLPLPAEVETMLAERDANASAAAAASTGGGGSGGGGGGGRGGGGCGKGKGGGGGSGSHHTQAVSCAWLVAFLAGVVCKLCVLCGVGGVCERESSGCLPSWPSEYSSKILVAGCRCSSATPSLARCHNVSLAPPGKTFAYSVSLLGDLVSVRVFSCLPGVHCLR